MLLQKKLPWSNPLDVARGIPKSEEYWALLYSGIDSGFSGRYSILAFRAKNKIKSQNFGEFEKALTSNRNRFDNAWIGYLGYGLKNNLEKLPEDSGGVISMPNLWMVKYRTILLFDHKKKIIELWSENKSESFAKELQFSKKYQPPDITSVLSNMTRKQYLSKVSDIKKAIIRGDLYQANLTRKFIAKTKSDFDNFSIFSRLCKISPAPYSAFLKFNDNFVISSSPERFIHIDKNGVVESRPIKGSAPRFSDKTKDKKSKSNLIKSEKDKAENLMIVDLMRNDLSRSCKSGSVEVKSLFDILSYSTVHHMSSTVCGKKNPNISTIGAVKNCFPPGSMTGAPKIKAMELCSKMEKHERGIYGGAIGWFGGDGSADLSVVIRTIIKQKNTIEFQVGGAIVADSKPEEEWKETILKAKAIAKTLGIKQKTLENI